MKIKRIAFLLIVVSLALASFGCGAAASGPTPTPEPHPGQALVSERCSSCHGVWQVEAASLSRDDWQEMVESMVMKGATLTTQEEAQVVDYLAITFPTSSASSPAP